MDVERSPREIAGLMVLTFTSGMVDAVGFIALGRVFCALATGNVLFLGLAVAGEPQLAVSNTATALASFATGLGLGHWLLSGMERRGRRWFRGAIGAEAVALTAASALSWGLVAEESAQLSGRHYAVVALLALAMGARAATAQRVAVPGMSTILVTTALALLFGRARTAGPGATPTVHRWRYLCAVLSIFAGAASGTLLLHVGVTAPLLVAAVLAVAVSLFGGPGTGPGPGRAPEGGPGAGAAPGPDRARGA
ncbi:YoaK family protein [Streptomyces sp. DSM 42041]|uniref:YoaK family protein n=1 Tax=Streptomyces hazeniae TaxID=3075538 RepID=A0ABU2NPF0_9ACTN|nr:YoaK family protein [Streptomyces sp. DSM 42041]MDT0378860.1 YoaK family protein [Streptomyces sp. DSM 42041]